MTLEMYVLFATAVTMYCLIQIPSAGLSEGGNITGSFFVALIVGWCSWPVWIAVLIWVRINPDIIRDHLKDNNDPRYKDYGRKRKGDNDDTP